MGKIMNKHITFLNVENGYETSIINCLYAKYIAEMQYFSELKVLSQEAFKVNCDNELQQAETLLAICEGELVGVLKYYIWQEEGVTHCEIPLLGYGAKKENEEKYMSLLFQQLAGQIVAAGETIFTVHIYAHDELIKQLFTYMQFGMIAETGIKRITQNGVANTTIEIRTLTKGELTSRWEEVWQLIKCIIDHLKESPIFYKGEEFTEEAYKPYFMDADTNVHIAFDQAQKMIGMIESNQEEKHIIFGNEKSINVGEVYVVPAYRNSGLAEDLLDFAHSYEKQRGALWSWVEHGTANPNARGFWNKYFKTYTYEMIRKIEV